MNRKNFATSLILVMAGAVILAAAVSRIVGGAKLTVSRKLFPISEENSRFLYEANLQNGTLLPLSVEGLKLPGGFAGAGTFYPCRIDVRIAGETEWTTPVQGTLDETDRSSGNLKSWVMPFQSLNRACGAVLPLDGMKNIDCVRIQSVQDGIPQVL